MSVVQHQEDAERIRVGREEVAVRVTSGESGGRVLALDVSMPPGGGPPALHRHSMVEVYRVLEGELAFHLGDGEAVERVVAPAGAVVHVAGGREHTIRNESGRTARAFVTFVNGADRMEQFVRGAGELAERGTPTLDEVLELSARHGVQITRPIPGGA